MESTKVKLTTSAASTYEYKFNDSGNLIYDSNNIKIVIKAIVNNNQKTGISVYIENNTDTDWTVQVRNTSINGFMVDPIFSPVVCSKKCIIDSIDFYNSELAENGIEKINEAEISFLFLESGNYLSNFDTGILKFEL